MKPNQGKNVDPEGRDSSVEIQWVYLGMTMFLVLTTVELPNKKSFFPLSLFRGSSTIVKFPLRDYPCLLLQL